MSVLFLKRSYNARQWISICGLVTGVIVMGLSHSSRTCAVTSVDDPSLSPKCKIRHGAVWIGILSAIMASFAGGSASVATEMAFKHDSEKSIWVTNAQLSLFSLVPAIMAMFYDAANTPNYSPMQSFTLLAWLLVIARSIGGIVVSFLLKYCDCVLKGFATSLALVLTLCLEYILHMADITWPSFIGACLIVGNSHLYIQAGSSRQAQQQQEISRDYSMLEKASLKTTKDAGGSHLQDVK